MCSICFLLLLECFLIRDAKRHGPREPKLKHADVKITEYGMNLIYLLAVFLRSDILFI